MANLLHIETATTVCSVALSKDDALQSIHEKNDGYRHAEHLSMFIDQCLKDAGLLVHDLDGLVISLGPGSYTGLRIGVSTVKGMAFGLGIPVIGISTLDAMTYNKAVIQLKSEMLLAPMIDARRMEVYTALYKNNQKVNPIQALVFDEELISSYTDPVLMYGPGADKLAPLVEANPKLHLVKGVHPSAQDLMVPGSQAFARKEFLDAAYFEPFYLKDFVAGKPKKLV